MNEPELTPEIARSLFGGKPEPESEQPETAAEAVASTTAEQIEAEPELTADQLELADRYGLTAQEVRRVRGRSWAERCEDAERLAAIVKQQPNRGEIAALAAHKKNQHQALIELLHPSKPKGDEQA
jgi:hypothetical protein